MQRAYVHLEIEKHINVSQHEFEVNALSPGVAMETTHSHVHALQTLISLVYEISVFLPIPFGEK